MSALKVKKSDPPDRLSGNQGRVVAFPRAQLLAVQAEALKGEKIDALAAELDCARSTAADYRNGKRLPPLELQILLAARYPAIFAAWMRAMGRTPDGRWAEGVDE